MNEVDRGGFPLSLCEYVSRNSRLEIVKLIVENIADDINQEKMKKKACSVLNYNNRRSSRARASLLLADYLGVHKNTVNSWLRRDYQSCNINTEKLLDLAFNVIPSKT